MDQVDDEQTVHLVHQIRYRRTRSRPGRSTLATAESSGAREATLLRPRQGAGRRGCGARSRST